MEVIKCGLCKEEIEYAQRCRVYVKTDELRPYQRISKRPHIGRYKLISTAKSTEHISFARRLKRIREIRDNLKSTSNSISSPKVDQRKRNSVVKKVNPRESNSLKKPEPRRKIETDVKGKQLKVRDSASSTKTKHNRSGSKASNKIIAEKIETSEKINCVDKYLEPLKKSAAAEENLIETVSSEPKNPRSLQRTSPRKVPISKNMNLPHFQSSFEEYIKPSLSKNISTPNRETKRKNSDLSNEFDQNKRLQVTSTPKSVKNGSVNNSKNSDCETYYWLEIQKPKQPELRKLGYDFESLVTEVKHMKLPNADWKIKIMVHKQEMVSVSFTKKLFPEKIVSVNAKSSICDIAMDGKKLILLGSPTYIHSIKDLEIMLDIVDDLQIDSPMITYLKTGL